MSFEKIADLAIRLNPFYLSALAIHKFHADKKCDVTTRTAVFGGSLFASIAISAALNYMGKSFVVSALLGGSCLLITPVWTMILYKISEVVREEFS